MFDFLTGILACIGLLVVVLAVLIATGVIEASVEITIERNQKP